MEEEKINMANVITKTDLVDKVAAATEITKAEATKVVAAVLDAIKDELAAGNEVNIAGFGKFVVRDRAARTGKNPATGEAIQIPATKAPAFVAGKALKDAIKA